MVTSVTYLGLACLPLIVNSSSSTSCPACPAGATSTASTATPPPPRRLLPLPLRGRRPLPPCRPGRRRLPLRHVEVPPRAVAALRSLEPPMPRPTVDEAPGRVVPRQEAVAAVCLPARGGASCGRASATARTRASGCTTAWGRRRAGRGRCRSTSCAPTASMTWSCCWTDESAATVRSRRVSVCRDSVYIEDSATSRVFLPQLPPWPAASSTSSTRARRSARIAACWLQGSS